MKQILFFFLVIISLTTQSQTLYQPPSITASDSILVPVNVGSAVRKVYNIDLVKFRAAKAAGDTATVLRILIAANTSNIALKSPIANPAFTGTVKIGSDTAATKADVRAGGGGGSASLWIDDKTIKGNFDSTSPGYVDTVYMQQMISRWMKTFPGYLGDGSKSLRDNFTWQVTGSTNAAPVASSVAFTGTATQGQTLTGTYTYSDAESDPQGTSTKQWYRSDNTSALNRAAISGATSTTYLLAAADTTKYIQYAVTPVATSGTSPGSQVFSSYSTAIASSGGGLLVTETFNRSNTSDITGSSTSDGSKTWLQGTHTSTIGIISNQAGYVAATTTSVAYNYFNIGQQNIDVSVTVGATYGGAGEMDFLLNYTDANNTIFVNLSNGLVAQWVTGTRIAKTAASGSSSTGDVIRITYNPSTTTITIYRNGTQIGTSNTISTALTATNVGVFTYGLSNLAVDGFTIYNF